MTFKEFHDSHWATAPCWCVVTLRATNTAEVSIVLQWEPSNYKWNIPCPYECREEVGSYSSIGPIKEYGGIKGEIQALQIITCDNNL